MMRSKKGFTLVEMSVVVLVIGLLIGAVIVGQSMVRSAQLQGAIADVDIYKKAIQAFKDKYNYLPGDLPTAEAIWGGETNCPRGPVYTNAPRAITCNGDGNGIIEGLESLRSWQQLANSELISGAYNGLSSGNINMPFARVVSDLDVNVPKSSIKTGGFNFFYQAPLDDSTALFFAGEYGHVLVLGSPIDQKISAGSIITPVDALSVDKKIDDGLPGSGIISVSPANIDAGFAGGPIR
jgi:prepilin-type N-terminal cleavage/methylation domain-containing protein